MEASPTFYWAGTQSCLRRSPSWNALKWLEQEPFWPHSNKHQFHRAFLGPFLWTSAVWNALRLWQCLPFSHPGSGTATCSQTSPNCPHAQRCYWGPACNQSCSTTRKKRCFSESCHRARSQLQSSSLFFLLGVSELALLSLSGLLSSPSDIP